MLPFTSNPADESKATFSITASIMVQTIQARDITLHDLETKFGLTLVEIDQFFREWQDDLPEISDSEKQRLDRV